MEVVLPINTNVTDIVYVPWLTDSQCYYYICKHYDTIIMLQIVESQQGKCRHCVTNRRKSTKEM